MNPTDTKQTTSQNYILLFILMIVSILNFIDRQMLASFANFIVPEFNLQPWQFGLLTGFAFTFIYSIMGIFMGMLADRVHRIRLLATGVGLWSILTAISGAATGFISLLIPRIFIGVGESIATPTSMSLLSDRFPSQKMGLIASIYYLGVPIGIALSLLMGAYIEPLIGWRHCFYLLGILGVITAIGLLFIKETPRRISITKQRRDAFSLFLEIQNIKSIIKQSKSLRTTIIGGIIFHILIGATVLGFDQLWFVQERALDRTYILKITGWIIITSGIIGNVAGGYLSDIWQKKTKTGRPMFLFWVLLLFYPLTLSYRLVESHHPIFWIGIFLSYLQLGLFYGPTFSTIQELSPAKMRATMTGFYLLVLNLIGITIGSTGAGFMISALEFFEIQNPYTLTLITFTILTASCIPLMYVAGKNFYHDKALNDPL